MEQPKSTLLQIHKNNEKPEAHVCSSCGKETVGFFCGYCGNELNQVAKMETRVGEEYSEAWEKQRDKYLKPAVVEVLDDLTNGKIIDLEQFKKGEITLGQLEDNLVSYTMGRLARDHSKNTHKDVKEEDLSKDYPDEIVRKMIRETTV